jgi:hypothetical protein
LGRDVGGWANDGRRPQGAAKTGEVARPAPLLRGRDAAGHGEVDPSLIEAGDLGESRGEVRGWQHWAVLLNPVNEGDAK